MKIGAPAAPAQGAALCPEALLDDWSLPKPASTRLLTTVQEILGHNTTHDPTLNTPTVTLTQRIH